MRIAWLKIENFRSIKKLQIDGLDKPQVVIEGFNDVGKSNILHAMDIAFSALPRHLRPELEASRPIWLKDWDSVFRYGESFFSVSFGIRFKHGEVAQEQDSTPIYALDFLIEWTRQDSGISCRVKLRANEDERYDDGFFFLEANKGLYKVLSSAFRLVTTQRSIGPESLSGGSNFERDSPMVWQGNNLKQMLFFYKNSPDVEVQDRFEQLRVALRDPELNVGNVHVSVQSNRAINVRTRQGGLDHDIEQRGSGIQQLVSLLALTLCHRGRILAVEEPEMNLSEPNQRLLWKKLREFTGLEGPMDQVFVTSHSRVFEEEAERLIVSRDPELGTQVRWAEPVPAKKQAEEEVLHVARGGSVTLPADMMKQLGIQEEKHVYLVPTQHGYQLLGPQGYADHLRGDGSDADSAD